MNAIKGAFPRRPSGRALCALVIVLFLGAVACRKQAGVESSKKVAPAPPVEAKGPIIAMLIASSVDAEGRAVNPRFNFPQKEPQITAIVRVGKIAGSPLNVAWYKTSDDSDEKLFEHQIQVKSNDRAFSVGKNPGKALAAGTYKVVATLEGQTQEMNWDVTPQKPVASKDRAPSSGETRDQTHAPGSYQRIALIDSAQTSPNPATTPPGSSDADGQPPVAGSSGTLPSIGTASDICIGGGDDDMCGPEILDSTAPFVDLYVHNGSGQTVKVQGGMTQSNGVPEDQRSPVGTVTPAEHSKEFRWDPCYYFPGSDLPGTKFQFFVSTTNTVATLGSDTSAPTVNVISTPARGTKVRAGDKINLKVTANEQHFGGSWQTGVKVIQITAEPGGLVKDPRVNPSNLPKACDDKTWEQKDEATYTVPKDPPPIIKICVIAEDYAGNQGSKCGEFRTANKWNGKFHLVSSVSNFNETWDGKFSVVVGANGDVQGKGSAHCVAAQCPWGNNATQAEFDVRGTFKRSQFQLAFSETAMDGPNCGLANYTFFLDPEFISIGGSSRSPSGFTVPVMAPGDAEAKLSNSATVTNRAVGGGQITITMLCEDCQ